jgi:predicted nucleotidyltransferase
MVAFIDQHQDRIDRVCQRWGVKRLEAFGSVLGLNFSAASDVDFLVEFDGSRADAFDQYFGLKEELESIVGRPVDLVVASAIRNPYFRAEVEQTKSPVYVAA